MSNSCGWLRSLGLVQLLRPHGLQAYQVPMSVGFPRQEYWSGLPFPSPIIDYYLQELFILTSNLLRKIKQVTNFKEGEIIGLMHTSGEQCP